jgi:Tfp pilus assembly protein PilN
MIFRTTVGVEISGKDVRIAIVRSVMGKLRFIDSITVAGFTDLTPEEQRTALAELAVQKKVGGGRIYLSLPRSAGIVRQMEFPVEVQERLSSVIALQLDTLCPWPVEEIYWDFGSGLPAKHGKTVTATVVIIARATLSPWIELFRSANVPLSGACLASVCGAHAVRALWTDASPTIVLDCEPEWVEASLVDSGRLGSVTEKGENAATAVKTAIERLVSVCRMTSPETARLVAYGTSLGTVEGLEATSLPLENARPATTEAFGAIAPALLGLKKSGFESNLIPRNLQYRRNQMQLVPTYILLLLTVLLGCAIALQQPYQMLGYASQLQSEIDSIAPNVKDVSLQEAELNKLSEKHRTLAGHLEKRDRNLEALRELSRSLPETAWLTSYSYQDGTVTVSGFAVSASEVQKLLEDTALFKDVQFTSSVSRDASGKDRFSMRASIEVTR